MFKWSFISFGVFLLLLVGTEIWFRNSKYAIQPEPFDTEVNRRSTNTDIGWPEYLEGTGEEFEKFGVLISNSQGASYEFDDDNLIYFKYLKDSLKSIIPNLEMANWSVPGIRTVDVELLSLQAKERGADFIIYVLGPGNFDKIPDVNLDFSSTDVNLLAGKPRFWAMEKHTIYGQNIDIDDRLKRFINIHSALARSRETFYEQKKGDVLVEEHLFYFGNYYRMNLDMNNANLTQVWKTLDEPTNMAYKKKELKRLIKKDNLINDRNVESVKTLAIFNDNLQNLFRDGETKIFFVSGPGPHFKANGAPRPGIANFVEVFDSMAIDSSFTYKYNLWDAVELSYFHPNSTHLNEDGHFFFSNLLFSLIKDEF